MSCWTYIEGVIEVDTFGRSDAEAMYLAQTVVNNLPRITGSEGSAKFYFSRPDGYCSSSNVDEFDQPSNLYNDRFFRAFNTQERVLITVKGNLRDRLFKQTLKETTKMLARLSSRLWVLNCLVRVRSDMDETFIFNNPKWVYKREITDWARNLLWKFDDGKDQ